MIAFKYWSDQVVRDSLNWNFAVNEHVYACVGSSWCSVLLLLVQLPASVCCCMKN